ncbi:MAG: DUF1624 domain-containing protein [Candidatus Binatia bacterium]
MEGRPQARNDAIDWLRGAVMILMALDHTRMFLGHPVDLHTAPAPLYFTRWVTHFCAPVFVLLAGTAAYLHGRQLGSTRALAGYLVRRGLWLVVLEVTVVRIAWLFQIWPDVVILQVIWAIGASMMALAGLVWLPRPAIAAFAATLIVGHNLLDAVHADQIGAASWLWLLLHEGGRLEPFTGATWIAAYPLVPWVGVMAAGYALGPWVVLPREQRRTRFARAGLALIGSFLLLRTTNLYGDPHAWSPEGEPLRAALSFLDCEKYPPSLLFLGMTLGPALCALAWMDRPLGPWAMRVCVYGRVPLFYYVLHLFAIHALSIALAWPELGSAAVTRRFIADGGLGYSLPAVYAFWLSVVLVLYPACRWFAGVKRRSRSAWVSYL